MGGWDVHAARDRNGCTALNWAAGEGRLDVVRVLIEELNVDANALTGKPKRKRHSLHWAARNGHVEVSAYFIFKRGVSPDIPTEDGTTPLHYACMMSHLEMARWLVDEAHCDVNSLNSFGCNASQWCALAGCVPVMKLLRERGLDLYLLNRNGHSVLHKSAMKGMVAAVDFFIQVTYCIVCISCACSFLGLGVGMNNNKQASFLTPIPTSTHNSRPLLPITAGGGGRARTWSRVHAAGR